MFSRICCLLCAPKSPKLVFLSLLATAAVVIIGLLYFADFRQLLHSAVFRPSFEERASLHHNVPRFRPHHICPSSGLNSTATIFVISSPGNILKRQVIRSTWGHPEVTKAVHVGVVFLVGDSEDASVGRLADWEAEVYGDVVQSIFVDSYDTLSFRTLAGLKWALEYCSRSSFFIKVHDDVFVNVYALERFLKDHKNEDSSLMCLVWNSMPVLRRRGEKWSEAIHQFNGTIYPTYCSGSAYIMSIPVAQSLYKASLTVPIFWLEDVFITGILAKHAGISHKQIGHMYAFKSRNISDLAHGKVIFAHLDEEKSVPGTRMWKEVYAFENKKANLTSVKGRLVMRDIVT